ncbi:MAG: TylF/MycF/NovP-related O-methyltransferase [Ferruginibacter sp.]
MGNKLTRQLDKVSWFIKNYTSINKDALVTKNIANYNSDGLTVFNNCDCLITPKFTKAYKASLLVNDWRGLDGNKFDMRWRYYIVCSLADQVKHLEGDFVECGVYKGGYSMAVINYIDFTKLNKQFWLFDTYEGLAWDHLTEKEKKAGLFEQYQHYESSYEVVQKNFGNLPAKIIKGTVPETLSQCTASKIAYLSIDMNCVEPEISAAEYFWDKIVKGGVVILDDYGFRLHIEQKLAFDKFANEKNVPILQLPTGQGIIFKP